MSNAFSRIETVLGVNLVKSFSEYKIIIFGLGGVGGWCAESLVRTGFSNITLVDYDIIAESNINRQLPATVKTVGKLKTEVLAERFRDINPEIHLTVRSEMYSPENADTFNLNDYDIIVDCIDSLNNKMHLIREATKTDAFFISSMGAALKVDPSQIRVDEFWKVRYDLFARCLRKNIRKGELPAKPFPCVYSLEKPVDGYEIQDINGERKRVNGSLVHVTAIFGFTIAGEICKYLQQKSECNE